MDSRADHRGVVAAAIAVVVLVDCPYSLSSRHKTLTHAKNKNILSKYGPRE